MAEEPVLQSVSDGLSAIGGKLRALGIDPSALLAALVVQGPLAATVCLATGVLAAALPMLPDSARGLLRL